MTKTASPSGPKNRSERLISFLGSSKFFWIVMAVFTFQALWIALTARYPQAFDEQFHFGIIDVYSHHISPILSSQPTSADHFGAITQDPSYLYQYVMSFPLRLLRLFTDNLTTQIICIRILSVAMLGSSLIVFRKLFRALKVSDALSNVVLFCVVLTPVTPLLGAQVNYDNPLVLLSAITVYLTVRFSQRLRSTKTRSWEAVCRLLILCLLASLVKYAFIPIFAAIVIWVFMDWRWYRRQAGEKPARSQLTGRQYARIITYGVLLLLSLGLFMQRYGVNMIRYHTPIPECNQVLSVQRCEAFGSWARNYNYVHHGAHLPLDQILTYPFVWIYHTLNELIFTVSGRFTPDGDVTYPVGHQLIVIEVLAWTIFLLGVAALLVYGRRLARNRSYRFLGLVILLYIAALGGQNYLDYLHLGRAIAIHGRYLSPILPLIYLLVALAFRSALQALPPRRSNVPLRKLSMSVVVIVVLLLEGGGFTTYIIRSNDSWSWPQSRAAQQVNDQARKLLKPIVIDTGN